MKIPILSGIFADSVADFVDSVPINREPVVMETGLSEGYLRVGNGITFMQDGPGANRGGIAWNGVCYRVMGTKFISVAADGSLTELGDVGEGGHCSFDYSFDNLIIASGGRLYYWNATAGFRQVTDPDLGTVVDAIWIDGYTMTTDGESLVVTELNDPMAVDPLKYGSSEEDPDPVIGLFKIRGEVYALNRNTIEVFSNSGSTGFPFAPNPGAQIPYGCVGTHAKTLYLQSFAFVGSARNEQPGVYLAGGGDASKLSTKRIDGLLAKLTDEELAAVTAEARVDENEQRLLIHLPDKTLVFYYGASTRSGQKIWAIMASGIMADQAYRGRSAVLAYGKWIVADSAGKIGYIDPDTDTHFGDIVGWQFDTALLFNEAGRAIVNTLELQGLPGRGDGRVFMSFTIDGVTWSQERAISTGAAGQRNVRMQARLGVRFNQWISFRFRGADHGMAAFARLDAGIEALG